MIIGISFALLRTLVSVLWHTLIAPRGAPVGSLMLGLRLKRGDAVAARGAETAEAARSVPAGRPPSTEYWRVAERWARPILRVCKGRGVPAALNFANLPIGTLET